MTTEIENDNNEKLFLVTISRVTFTDQDIIQLEKLLKLSLDWFYILAQAYRQKIAGLIWTNLNNLGFSGFLPRVVAEPLKYFSFAGNQRFQIMENEYIRIQKAFELNNINIYPLKGCKIIPEYYNNGFSRISNDFDFLISKSQSNNIINIMKQLGYINGEFDPHKKDIIPYSRERWIMWMKSSETLPIFYLNLNKPFIDFMAIDFRHSINERFDIVDDMISCSNNGELDSISFFLHLCYHAYEEAGKYSSLDMLKDLTLMKFCDIREYIIRHITTNIWPDLINRTRKYGLEKSLVFCLNALKIIYHDDYINEVKKEITEIDDLSVMDTYGLKDYGQEYTFNKSFIERLFSFSNKNEIKVKPSWADIL
jgi:hypothetical protein